MLPILKDGFLSADLELGIRLLSHGYLEHVKTLLLQLAFVLFFFRSLMKRAEHYATEKNLPDFFVQLVARLDVLSFDFDHHPIGHGFRMLALQGGWLALTMFRENLGKQEDM